MLEFSKDLIYIVPAALIAIIFHEMAHGLVSHWQGDPTPKQEGRLSLNPARHLDPVGTLCLIFFGFGWAKPVHVNPQYYRNPRLGMVFVALAGPLMNFIVALITFVFLVLGTMYNFAFWIQSLLWFIIVINIGLGVFNLLPIPPLDGSKLIGALIPDKYYYTYLRYEKYGMILLVVLLATGVFDLFLADTVEGFMNIFRDIANWLVGLFLH
ncbi:MAG TPA: site-2 protease family protein [Acholeplasmataceae bacterium]|jgi:Zn-dependent protease|nr:site-2 protease family protein [Acholeplasmataceae bacterium]